jgi:flagellar biogenesis protein FliO
VETVDLARFIFSFLGVVALILIFAWIIKRLDIEKKLAAMRKDSRIAVLESCAIDAKHKLVMVRADHRVHLLLLGAGSLVCIESSDLPREKESL